MTSRQLPVFHLALSIVSLLISSTLLSGCANNTTCMAGGTTVGNPGVITTVSLVADTAFDMPGIHEYSNHETVSNRGEPGPDHHKIPIHDLNNFMLTVTSASMRVQKIIFILDESENPSRLIHTMDTKLFVDSGNLVLKGPFLFDALNGVSVPSLDNIWLPPAKYAGIRLVIDSPLQPARYATDDQYPVILEGTFKYRDTTRRFSIRLCFSEVADYRRMGPPFHPNTGNRNIFLIGFNAQRWLEKINLKMMLDKKEIYLDKNGDMTIDNSIDTEPLKKLKMMLRGNIMKSGKLFIKKKPRS